MASYRHILECYMKKDEDPYQFALWAFGEEFENMPGHEMVPRWNKLHSEKLRIFDDGQVSEDIPIMLELWRNDETK